MPNTVAVLDQFHGAASSLLAAHVPSEGSSWTIPPGRAPALDGAAITQWLNAGGITLPNPNTDPVPQALQPGNIAGDVSLLFAFADLGGSGEEEDVLGVLARYTSATQWYGCVYNPNNIAVELRKQPATAQITLATSDGIVPTPTAVPVLWQISGADHAIWVPGLPVVTYTDAANPFLDPGQVGLCGSAQGNATPTSGSHLSQFLAIAGLLLPMP